MLVDIVSLTIKTCSNVVFENVMTKNKQRFLKVSEEKAKVNKKAQVNRRGKENQNSNKAMISVIISTSGCGFK